MTDTDRTFYDLAMAEIGTFVAAGPFASSPAKLSDDVRERLMEAWSEQVFYHAAMEESSALNQTEDQPRLDLNRKLVPSLKEVEELPRRARIAIAARCARRVFPLFKFARGIPHDFMRVLHNAIRIAEEGTEESTATYYGTYHFAEAVFADAHNAAASAYAAARAALTNASYPHIAVYASRAIDSAFHCLSKTVSIGTIGQLLSIARDFDHLQRVIKREKWDDTTLIPASAFGPMWDGTPPKWWTASSSPDADDPPMIEGTDPNRDSSRLDQTDRGEPHQSWEITSHAKQ